MRHLKHIALTLLMLCALAMGSAPVSAQAALPADVITRPGARGAITMHYPQRFSRAASTLDTQARDSIAKLEHRLGMQGMEGIDVWLLSDLDDYFTWNEVASRAPTWAIGLSLVNRKTVLVRHGLGPDRQLVDIHKTFDHELAHVAIDVARQGHPVPRWFNEGFASFQADEWTLERGEEVARAAATHTLIPLKKLEHTFPDHQQTTSLAYAQSHHFVRHLATRYGEDVFSGILAQIRRGETFSVAFTMTTGDDFERVEKSWREDLAQGSSPLSGLADGGILFFGASLLFLVAWAKRRRRSREKFARLDDELEGWDYDPARYKLPSYGTGVDGSTRTAAH